jgi:predicted Zn-dependent protease with MMP-like domain
MAHNRKLVIGSVALTKARVKIRLAGPAMDNVRDDLEREIVESSYLANAPFRWVGLIIREGLVDETEPHYQRISAKHGDLPVAIEIDTYRLLDATEDEMAAVYRKATLIALTHAGKKYGLNTARVDQLLSEAG